MAMNKNRKKEYEWRKQNIVRYDLTLNKEKEKDIIRQLNCVSNKREYIIYLIRKDIK